MELLEFLLGALCIYVLWRLFGSPIQQQDYPEPYQRQQQDHLGLYRRQQQNHFESYQRQQRQWEPSPYRASFQPAARPEQPPSPLYPWQLGQNEVDQQSDSWSSLRARAKEEGDAMAKSFRDSREARANGDYALAHELSNKGERHRAEMDRLNKTASEWIFAENNKDRQPGEVDLHGLYVKEATAFTKRFVQKARNRGDTQISLIVGQGRHSINGAAKIKPAIESLMRDQYNFFTQVDPSNAGVLIVSLDGQARGAGRVVRADSLARDFDYLYPLSEY